MPDGTCSVEGCEKTSEKRGWCGTCYTRWRKHGNPQTVLSNLGKPAQERFGEKVNRDGPIPAHRPELGACAQWGGALQSHGYGTFGVRLAHKWAYEQVHGPVPDGLEIDHLCRNHACVRVDHLEAVTHAENMRRGVGGKVNNFNAKKTHCPAGHPYDHANTRLTVDGARKCRICEHAQEARRVR